jgi:hypothetical protein
MAQTKAHHAPLPKDDVMGFLVNIALTPEETNERY